MRPKTRIRRLCAWTTLTTAALAGCGSDAPPIGLVSGTVTRLGQPVPNLTINFMPANGRPSWGMTDSGGFYRLHWDEDNDGAEVGIHKVSVAFVPGSQGEESGRAKLKSKPSTPVEQKEIVSKYGFEKTPLTQEVKPGRQTIDLKLD